MLKFIEGEDLVEELRSLMKETNGASLAVAFWGRDSGSKLNIEQGRGTRIICNLESGACLSERDRQNTQTGGYQKAPEDTRKGLSD